MENRNELNYFAGQALNGILSTIADHGYNSIKTKESFTRVVNMSWDISEMMLAEKRKRFPQKG